MLYFTIQKSSPSSDESGLRSGGCEMTILCSDYRRIIVGLSSNRLSIGGSIQGVSAEILSFKISWQAQYLVRLPGHFTCSTHWKWRFICDADQGWCSFCVAGAVFGNVGGWLFVTGASLRDIFGDGNDAKCCILQYKIVPELGRVRSPKRRVRDDDFVFGLSSDYPRIVFLLAEAFREFPLKSWASRFRGRRSIWWGCRVTLLAPRIGNDVSYVTQIRDDIHFAWQAQYLVRLAGDFSWQAQHFVTFWEIAGTPNVVFYNTKSSPSWDE